MSNSIDGMIVRHDIPLTFGTSFANTLDCLIKALPVMSPGHVTVNMLGESFTHMLKHEPRHGYSALLPSMLVLMAPRAMITDGDYTDQEIFTCVARGAKVTYVDCNIRAQRHWELNPSKYRITYQDNRIVQVEAKNPHEDRFKLLNQQHELLVKGRSINVGLLLQLASCWSGMTGYWENNIQLCIETSMNRLMWEAARSPRTLLWHLVENPFAFEGIQFSNSHLMLLRQTLFAMETQPTIKSKVHVVKAIMSMAYKECPAELRYVLDFATVEHEYVKPLLERKLSHVRQQLRWDRVNDILPLLFCAKHYKHLTQDTKALYLELWKQLLSRTFSGQRPPGGHSLYKLLTISPPADVIDLIDLYMYKCCRSSEQLIQARWHFRHVSIKLDTNVTPNDLIAALGISTRKTVAFNARISANTRGLLDDM